MQGRRGLLLAVAVVGILTLAVLPGPEAQPANRRPHAILGPDQVVRDSSGTCSVPASYVGCVRIDVNFNQSWDPDPADTLTAPGTYTFAHAVTPNGPPCTTSTGLIAPPGAGATAPWAPVSGERGKYYTYAPIIADAHVTRCHYAITVTINDGHGAFNTNNCCAQSRINITVLNDAEPPRFDCPAGTSNQCDPAALTVYTLNRAMAGPPPTLGPKARAKVNLADDRSIAGQPNRGYIWFEAHNVTDDKSVATLEVYLDLLDEQDNVKHRIVVPLQKDCDDPLRPAVSSDCYPYAQGAERMTWNGSLPVDTPELIVGSYQVWARAFDRDGLNTSFPMGKVTLEVESPDGDCHPLLASGGIPPCIKLNRPQVASNIPSACFAGEANPRMNVLPLPRERLSFALGHGETLRPQIQGPYPPDIEPGTNPPRPYFFTNPNLLLWKVTYQTCIEADVQPGQCGGKPTATRCALYGPEIPLESPYFMALDTLFNAATPIDQDVALRAYDRLGRVNGTAFHLVTDTQLPTYLVDVPATNYQGIPFQFNVLVHDRVDTELSLHIDEFEEGRDLDNLTTSCHLVQGACTAQSPPQGNVTLASGATVGVLNVVRVPRLGMAVGYDMTGQHDRSADCAFLFDANGDGLLDSILEPRTLVVSGKLLATQSAEGEYNDYIVDADGNGELTPGETLIVGSPNGRPAEAEKCNRNAFSSPAVQQFLRNDATQVYSYTLTRNTLGNTSYRLGIKDLVFNNYAAPYCDPDCSGVDANSTLVGSFTTVRALVDASIQNFTVSPGPFLPGDAVWLNVTLEQRSPQRPEPQAPMLLVVDSFDRLANGTLDCPQAELAPTGRVAARCQVVTPDSFVFLQPYLQAFFGANTKDTSTGCPNPSDPVHEFTVCIQRPNRADRLALVPYGPGQHTVAAFVNVFESVEDTDMGNNIQMASFEVYGGKVIHGTADVRGKATGSSKEYYIRMGERGFPTLEDGVVRLAADGSVQATYDLNYSAENDRQYRFTVDGTELYWNPTGKLSVDPSVCGMPSNSTALCTRPITVIPVAKATTTTTKPSPDAAALLPIVLALAAMAMRRRDD